MPFERPTLTDLKSQVASDIASSMDGVDPLLRFANMTILGKVLAQMTGLNYGYLDYIAKQAVPFTATDEFLEGWAGLKGVTREPAVAFVGMAAMVGVGTPETPIPAATPLVRGDQVAYATVGDAVVAADGSAVVQFEAVVPAADGTCDVGSLLVLGSSIGGVQSSWTVTESITPGADGELDASLKSRMLQVYRSPPQGGSKTDYETWALQVPGVTRAWCVPYALGVGTIYVYVMLDVTETAHGGVPQGTNGAATGEWRAAPATGDQLVVANHIFGLQPVGPVVYVMAPSSNIVPFTIRGLTSLSAAGQQAVAAAISAVFTSVTEMGATVYITDLEAAIAAAAGTEAFGIVQPSADIVNPSNAVPVLGPITWE